MRLPELLLEIGTEEIPSGYLNDAISASKEIFKKRLEEERIEIRAETLSFGTCRRLTLIFKDIADRQSDMVKEVIGPPKRIAFESDGSPTKAAIGFAKKFNVSVEELSIVETDKGEYLAVRDTVRGKATSEVLKELIPKCISQIPWPKSMRWADLNFSFVRPIHWIFALFDGKPIPFEIAGIKSGNLSRGHRFMSPDTFTVNNSTQYMKELMDRFVIVDPLKRKE
ncbi:MAG TPA: glycine--tRNA ligase subunit beta, partial [Desulfobacteraceae bacterium]|nr:glycine--tRNA ligase subunit beta [Desulfobacteraceae bacterium]